MKIEEITDQNKFLAKMAGINLNIDKEYEMYSELAKMLLKLQMTHLNNSYLEIFDMYKERLNEIIVYDFDEDQDIDEIKSKCETYLNNINKMISKLI